MAIYLNVEMKSTTAAVAKEKGELAAKTAGKVSYTNATVHGDGSVAFLLQTWAKDGFITATASVAAPYLFVSRLAWKVLGCYAAFELLLMRVLPGQMQSGPPSPTDHVPVYPRHTASHSPRSDCSRTLACRPWACLRPSGRDPRSSQSLQSSCAGCCTLKASTYRQTPMQVYQVI